MSYKELNIENDRRQNDRRHSQRNHAGFWLRLSATLIDILIILIIVSIIVPWVAPYLKDFLPHQLLALDKDLTDVADYLPAGDSPMIFAVLWLVVMTLCYIPPTVAQMQGTLGKWLVGIYVGDILGSRISFSTALFRFLCYVISLALLGIGFFMIAIDREKKALHDILCNTRVFKGAPVGANWVGAEDDYIEMYSHRAKAKAVGKNKSVGW